MSLGVSSANHDEEFKGIDKIFKLYAKFGLLSPTGDVQVLHTVNFRNSFEVIDIKNTSVCFKIIPVFTTEDARRITSSEAVDMNSDRCQVRSFLHKNR